MTDSIMGIQCQLCLSAPDLWPPRAREEQFSLVLHTGLPGYAHTQCTMYWHSPVCIGMVYILISRRYLGTLLKIEAFRLKVFLSWYFNTQCIVLSQPVVVPCVQTTGAQLLPRPPVLITLIRSFEGSGIICIFIHRPSDTHMCFTFYPLPYYIYWAPSIPPYKYG